MSAPVPLTTQLDVFSSKEEQMREVDALYDLIVDPKAVRMRRVLAGLEQYMRTRYALEFSNPQSSHFADRVNWQLAFCQRAEAGFQERIVRLQLLFTRLVCEGRVRAYFCEPGATDSSLDPTKTLVDPGAFDIWLRDYALAYTNDYFDGARMDIVKYTHSCAAMYCALLRNSPADHPRARARSRRQHT